MPLFRKKNDLFEAVQWYGPGDHPAVRSCGARKSGNTCAVCGRLITDHGNIKTSKGYEVVCPCDWIVTNVDGGYMIRKQVVFNQEYEAVVQ